MILVTGCAGFIGFSVTRKLLEQGFSVVGLDNLNSYYDVELKKARKRILEQNSSFTFKELDICNKPVLEQIFFSHPIQKICHLAAQAGVRYSLTHPHEYQKSNLEGFVNLIELAKDAEVENFVYASSSSVYGANTKLPFSETDPVETPISLYGATKRANELIAYTYSHLYKLPTTGLRFFTVYGPWGRPDMALFLFTRSIIEGKPIDVYNYGKMKRSFTYIDDIVEGILSCLKTPFSYEIFNLGNDTCETVMDYVKNIELSLGMEAQKNMLPIQPGDVPVTMADLTHSRETIGFSPKTGISEGVRKFVEWYREYYKV